MTNPDDIQLRAERERLRQFAHLLDSSVRLPGGFRIGLDGIIGLIPVVGDLIGVGLSSYLVAHAARLNVPRGLLVRMMVNVILEFLLGSIPLIGDLFDFVFKANERNMRLIDEYFDGLGH